ncbi:hypothetical protein SCB49_03929 [unidentified eubacterium SCB49]|nr:hypothetical protein SCB49_03929 [unidentified eubacterium SCB49]
MRFITRIAIIVLLFVGLTSFNVHKFYVSVTKVEYVKEAQSLQIITKIFIDDVEDVLNERFETETFLDTKKETPRDRELLKEYVLKKLKVEVNGQTARLDYLGIDYEPGIVRAYIEIVDVKECKTIGIENTMLMEKFEEQQNIVHFTINDQKRSLTLDKENPNGLLKFNE